VRLALLEHAAPSERDPHMSREFVGYGLRGSMR
jgi:hypothetical protein